MVLFTIYSVSINKQLMPSGTKVKFDVAGFGSVVGTSEFTWSDTNKNGGSQFLVVIKGEKDDLPKEGSLIVIVTTSNGNELAYNVANIMI